VNPFSGHNCTEDREMVWHWVGLIIVGFTLSKKIPLGVLYDSKRSISMLDTETSKQEKYVSLKT
jgi:hypothetical protein